MNYRHALLMSPQSLGASGTRIIRIDVQKPISRITMRFRTSRLQNYMNAPGPANVSKIEVVDGSKVLHGLTGYENQALAYYNRPNISMEHGQHIPGLDEVDLYTIDFGRYLWDEQLAFDPLRHSNPELKITFNQAVADTTCGANEVEVWADIFDEKVISPMGFLLATEHFDYTMPPTGGYEEISLPADRPIRQILVRAHKDGIVPYRLLDEARLDEGTMDQIPWDYTNIEDYYQRMKSVWPQVRTPFAATVNPAARVYYIPQSDYWANLQVIGVALTQEVYETSTSMEGGLVSLIGTNDGQVVGEARGYLPWSVFQFPMGKPDVIDDWYDPTGKKPRLRLHAGVIAATVTSQVVLEELYRY